MAYTYSIFDSIDQTPLDEWNMLYENSNDIFMDPRFIASVEHSMGDVARFWTMLIYDDLKRPVAAACIFLWSVDAATLSKSRIIKSVTLVRKWWRKFLFFKCLCVGLPVSSGQSHLRIREDADMKEVCRVIHDVLRKLSRQHHVKIVLLKEFDPRESERIEHLKQYGFIRGDSLPVNMFDPRFSDLNDYLSALRKRYRYQVKRSLCKTEKAGYESIEMLGSKVNDRIYTADVHRLYEAVLDRADIIFERNPVDFVREIIKRLGDQVIFTFVYDGDTVVAVQISLRTERVYYFMFIGINYKVSRESHLYFSTIYKHLDYVLQQGVEEIYIGQTADDFKMRLGCYQVPRYIYIRGYGAIGVLLKSVSKIFFPKAELSTGKNIWRDRKMRRN